MSKFRKKPVVIDAWELKAGMQDNDLAYAVADGRLTYNEDGTATIETLEGYHLANVGDFIIRGVNGELYPCKPDIFEKIYDIAFEVPAFQQIVITPLSVDDGDGFIASLPEMRYMFSDGDTPHEALTNLYNAINEARYG